MIIHLTKYDAQVKYWARATAAGMCGEYWRCYPNPGIGRHNTLAVGRIENSTLQLIFHTRRDWRVFQKKRRAHGGKCPMFGLLSCLWFQMLRNHRILDLDDKLQREMTKCFSFRKIAVWVGGDYVGGHILWWGQLRDGGELRGRGESLCSLYSAFWTDL